MSSSSPDPLLVDLLARVDRLEAVQQISAVHNDYVRALADRDWDRVAGHYTDDAYCDIRNHGVHRGRTEIRKMFAHDLENVVRTRDGYILSSPVITVNGDTATGEWIWHRLQSDFHTALGTMRVWGPWSEGKYICEYRRSEGVWRISKLWFRVHAPDSDDELLAAKNEARVIGALKPIAS